MNTRDLEAFVAVVESGSIVAASARLNLTQPGVTRRVQNLEETLGTALLDRQSKPLKPTSAGRQVYEQGRRVLRSLEDLRAGVAPDGPIGGEFRLGITPYLSETSLAEPLDRLRGAFPALHLRVTAGWSPRLLEQVTRSELDAAAVCLAKGQYALPEELQAESLGWQPVLLVAARDLAVPQPASLRDLAAFPWVVNQDGCGFRAAIRQVLESANLPLKVGIEAPSAELRLSLIARGLGIGPATPAGLRQSPLRDRLQIIETSDFQPRVEALVVHRPPAGRLAAPIAAFRQALMAELNAA